jgi:uncharacterized membrane protein YphA (DoxX/SURF4 family)
MSETTGRPLTGERPPPAGPARRAFVVIGLAARLLLGLIFLAAGALKAVDPAEFARQMAGYGIVGPGVSAVAAPLLIALEVALAAALLCGFRPRAVALGAAALLLIFIGVEAYGLSTGRTQSCGCFGAYVQRTPAEVIGEDLFFLALALLAWGTRAGSPDATGRNRRSAAVAVAASGLLALGFAAAAPSLPIDRLVTRLAPGRTLSELGIEGKVPGTGRFLVVLLDLTDPGAQSVAAMLNEVTGPSAAPAVIVLTPSSEEEKAAFIWSAIPAFEIRTVDRPVLKRLYRTLPRYFVVGGGRVVGILDVAPLAAKDLLSWLAS